LKNIILQHWTGKMGELEERSSINICKYAVKVGAEYRLLRGNVFRPHLSAPCQKVFMLDESFDEYDDVVMLDLDVFTRKGTQGDIFDPAITGIGRHAEVQDRLVKKLRYMYPHLGDPRYPYWGGSIHKISRDIRQRLRQHIREDEIIWFNDNFHDEGIMHRLAVRAKLDVTYLDAMVWNAGSFEPWLEDATTIHIRPRKLVDGKKVMCDKMTNYLDLVDRGLIDGAC